MYANKFIDPTTGEAVYFDANSQRITDPAEISAIETALEAHCEKVKAAVIEGCDEEGNPVYAGVDPCDGSLVWGPIPLEKIGMFKCAGSSAQTLNLETEQIYEGFVAVGANGLNGSELWARRASVTPFGPSGGNIWRYTIVFDVPHPDGDDYSITVGGHEDINNRDNPKITVVQATKSANGFQLMVTTDDNGTAPDNPANNAWSVSVDYPRTVVVDAELV
jgi:hypothetical protein